MMMKSLKKMPPLPPPLLDDEVEQDLLLMPAWKQKNGQEIVYVVGLAFKTVKPEATLKLLPYKEDTKLEIEYRVAL
ncbi:unnamed protein product [Cylicostephanus goldi]|uniref:Uncharacterized protein n=1 Tax=Cylicostephanus goldi TaxID=71465 RepID=A0A3P6S3D9_CYLGO|nr:unnamed protein product [Cylicostephanus goldi]